jgi:hypothetical protein
VSQIFGNRKASPSEFKAESYHHDGESDSYPFPIPMADNHGNIIEDDSFLEAQISYLLNVESKNRYVTVDVMNILARLGWQFDVRVNERHFLTQYAIVPPWGRDRLAAGGAPMMSLQLNEDLFAGQAELMSYVEKYGIHQIGSRPAAVAVAAVAVDTQRVTRKSRRNSDVESESRCSESTVGTKAGGIKKKTKKQQQQQEQEQEDKDTVKNKEKEKRGSNGSKGSKAKTQGKNSKKRAQPSESEEEEEEEEEEESQEESQEESDLSSSQSEEEEEEVEEEIPHVDPYPALSDKGIEGEIKEMMIAADAAGRYKFGVIQPYLKQLGWQFYIQSNNAINDYYILSPWGMKQYESEGKHIGMTMVRGKDFFSDNREVVEYIEKYGIHEVNDAVFTCASDKEDGGRLPRRSAAAMAPPPTASFAVPKGPVTKVPKRPAQAVSCPSSTPTGSHKVKKNVQKKTKGKVTSTSPLSSCSSSRGEEERADGDNEITLSQILSSMEEEKEKTALPEVDRECSVEIKAMIDMATTAPRLLLSRFQEVWSVLRSFGWSWFFETHTIGVNRVYIRPNSSVHSKNWTEFTKNVDYFTTDEEVLAFVKSQVQARGWNYTTLLDRARFTPQQPRCNDEAEQLEGEETEEEEEEEEEEEKVIRRKLPSRGLFQSGDNSYKAMFDHFDADSDVSDVENDIPSYSLASSADHGDVSFEEEVEESLEEVPEECTQSQDVEEVTQSQAHSLSQPLSQSQSQSSSLGSRSAGFHNKRKTPSQDSLVSIRSSSGGNSGASGSSSSGSANKKARTCSMPKTRSSAEKENSPAARKVESLGVVIDRVKNKLSPSYTPQSVMGRAEEYQELYSEVSGRLSERKGGSIRLAGQPGQGKTLTTTWMLRTLQKDAELEVQSPFIATWVEGSSMQGGYKELCESLKISPDGGSEEHAKSALKSHLLKPFPSSSGGKSTSKSRSRLVTDDDNMPMRIIVVDEIDMLPKALFTLLMQLANQEDSNFVLIGLANNAANGGYSHEIVFEVYQEVEMKAILKSLTENLLDEHAATMIVKTTSSNGE